MLEEIGAGEVPQLLVFNKIDCLPDRGPGIERDDQGQPRAVWLSALNGEGIELLFQALSERLAVALAEHELKLPPSAGRLRSILHEMKAIQQEAFDENGDCLLQIRLPLADWNRLLKQEGEELRPFIVN